MFDKEQKFPQGWGQAHHFLQLLIMIPEHGAGAGLPQGTPLTFLVKTSEAKRKAKQHISPLCPLISAVAYSAI